MFNTSWAGAFRVARTAGVRDPRAKGKKSPFRSSTLSVVDQFLDTQQLFRTVGSSGLGMALNRRDGREMGLELMEVATWTRIPSLLWSEKSDVSLH